MKKLFITLAAVSFTASVFAQAPQKMSYQAIIRDNSNILVTSTAIGMQISILQGSTPVYVETQTPTSDINGLVSLEIGTGIVGLGNFSTIPWANGPFFIKTETDIAGGTNYTITGTSQLLSVPYALYAEKSGSSTNSWLINGNASTIDHTNFIGTTDNVPLNFRVNNIEAGRIDNQLGNVFLGSASGVNTISSGNTAVGYFSFNTNTSGINNTALGANSLQISTTGNANTAIGGGSLSNNSTGSENVAIGQLALMTNTTGSKNTALGANAFMNGTLTNTTIIGYGATATVSNTMSLGNTAITDVKTAGTYTAGVVTYPNTLGNAGDVLTLPISGGNAYWSTPSAGSSTNYWNILGNTATVDGVNFIGTTDNIPFNIRVNNQKSGRIDHLLSNAFFGHLSGNSNTSGKRNTAMGEKSFTNNTIGNSNVAIGIGSLYSHVSGDENVAIGMNALYFDNTGRANTASGSYALYKNIDGYENTGNGYHALYSNTHGTQNTASGAFALYVNTTGIQNTAMGAQSLSSNTIGNVNTAIGFGAMTSNVSGNYNSAMGYGAMYTNISGLNNIAIGTYSMNGNTTGNYNIGIGGYTLNVNNGNDNTATGYMSLYSSTISSGNTAFGNKAGYNFDNGDNNTFIGFNADANVAGLNNASAIGYNAKTSVSNSLILGGTGADAVRVGVGTDTPTSPLHVVNLPIFVNNAAAVTGGLTVGAFYRTGGDPDLVCVVH